MKTLGKACAAKEQPRGARFPIFKIERRTVEDMKTLLRVFISLARLAVKKFLRVFPSFARRDENAHNRKKLPFCSGPGIPGVIPSFD